MSVCSVLHMTTRQLRRDKAFQAPVREALPALKEGQRRCPMCKRGVHPHPNGTLHWHNDESGARCDASNVVKAGYVYRGTGVDTLSESA